MSFPLLYVEGRDDLWSIQALLEKNGVLLTRETGPVEIKITNSVSELLDNMEMFIKASQNRKEPIGFVLDIDENLQSRWTSICGHLLHVGINAEGVELTVEGVVISTGKGPVGFWLMPDNVVHSGKLEDFLRTLIKADDKSLPLAQEYVSRVKTDVSDGKRFRDIDIEKAEMSAWLAVQETPGVPYGTAIKANILQPHSPVADKFVSWFKRLYGI